MSFDRRRFLQMSLMGTTVLGTPFSHILGKYQNCETSKPTQAEGFVIDTNVHLFRWPFRDLKYADTQALVDKLRQHGVRQAWAGSYEALFHKNIDRVNARLVWGGHLPSQSYANELSKIFDADLDDKMRKMIFGRNLRQIAAPIMRQKGYDVKT